MDSGVCCGHGQEARASTMVTEADGGIHRRWFSLVDNCMLLAQFEHGRVDGIVCHPLSDPKSAMSVYDSRLLVSRGILFMKNKPTL